MWLLKLEAMAIAQCPRNRKTKCNKYTQKQNKNFFYLFCKKKGEILKKDHILYILKNGEKAKIAWPFLGALSKKECTHCALRMRPWTRLLEKKGSPRHLLPWAKILMDGLLH